MIFRQFLHTEPVASSYLFGCGGHATCAVVDPVDGIDVYVRAASETHMNIRYVRSTRTFMPITSRVDASWQRPSALITFGIRRPQVERRWVSMMRTS